ncbi:hypothetical protein SAMN06295905_1887 [Devosia lucknowensis]|uniref:DUF1217 domain-containing protein n=1 Tax=Devosia lucknowensis TaxID=1096929 RepID=A0A1Y6F7E8_9HYPH|nr:hypothetical protein [Devosia lucknowensis]SMQ70326.1 hypothetical protein SAMN06295905_1887 [Devosia lucknowensis]
MVAVNSTSAYAAYQSYGTAYTSAAATRASTTASTSQEAAPSAAEVVLSDEAKAALSERSFASVITDARSKLETLLKDASRTSPLQKGKLALDMSSLDHRELYAMSSDASFSAEERDAAGLEMQRRFEAALSGPAAIAEVTGNYTNLYKAAAAYLDGLGAEERASTDWKSGRDAVAEGLKQLQTKPGTLPDAGDSDPVALYLALTAVGKGAEPVSMTDLAGNTRSALDQIYAQAKANGKLATFNRNTTTGTYVDLGKLSSRALSSIVLDREGTFTPTEVNAARFALQSKSGATLLAGFQSASKSGDPTAFSQNIIAAFNSMSSEERQAVGWSDQLYKAAMQSYASTSKLMELFGQATGGGSTPAGPGSLASLLGG